MGEMWSMTARLNCQLSKMASQRLLLLLRKLAHSCILSLATCTVTAWCGSTKRYARTSHQKLAICEARLFEACLTFLRRLQQQPQVPAEHAGCKHQNKPAAQSRSTQMRATQTWQASSTTVSLAFFFILFVGQGGKGILELLQWTANP